MVKGQGEEGLPCGLEPWQGEGGGAAGGLAGEGRCGLRVLPCVLRNLNSSRHCTSKALLMERGVMVVVGMVV